MDSPRLTASEVSKLHPGSLVIAVFKTDSQRYRAKVEKIATGNDRKRSFKVRYIDYGNSGEVEGSQLYTWEPLLEAVPAQAICCRLKDLKVFVEPILHGTKMAEHFSNSLKHFGPLKMTVNEILRVRGNTFQEKRIATELVVTLSSHSSGENIFKKLTVYPVLNEIMNIEDISTSGGQSANNLVLSKDPLDIIGECSAVPGVSVPPPPDHLKHCPLSCDTLSEFSLPPHPAVSFSVDKVSKWLPCLDGDIDDPRLGNRVNSKSVDESFKKLRKPLKEPEFSQSAAERKKLISDAKKVCAGGKSDRATDTSALEKKFVKDPLKQRKNSECVFPSQDIRKFEEVVSHSVPDLRKENDLLREEPADVCKVDKNPSEQIISTNDRMLDTGTGRAVTNDQLSLPARTFQDIEVNLKMLFNSNSILYFGRLMRMVSSYSWSVISSPPKSSTSIQFKSKHRPLTK